MKRRLTLLTAGYFVVIAIILVAVLPFVVGVLHVATTLEHQLGPANSFAQRYLGAAVDQETGERGYLITRQERFLDPYVTGNRNASTAYAALQRLQLQPNERAALERARKDLAAWNQQATLEIAATRAGDFKGAQAFVSVGSGRQLFEAFRADQARFAALVQSRLAHERALLRRNASLSIAALLAASAIAGASALLVRRWARGSTEREETHFLEQLAFAELHRMTASLAERRGADDVANAAVEQAAPLLGADIVRIWVREPGERLRLVAEHTSAYFAKADLTALSLEDANPASDVWRDRRPRFYPRRDDVGAEYPAWAAWWEKQGAEGFALLPLRADDEPFGVLLVWYRTPQDFGEHQRTLLELTADNIGAAFSRARTREREHDAALKLQESLLGPAMFVDGAGHTLRYLPAETGFHVGGDWFNTQRLADGRILLAVGDVVGRGIDAATTMGQLRSGVSACAPRCVSPSDLLDCIDEFSRDLPGAHGTTVALAYVDVNNERVEYLCAGHPPPLLVDPEGHVRLLDGALTWPLGIDDARPTRLGATTKLPAGSLLVFYSDGLVERRREPLDVGIDRLVTALEQHWYLPLELLCDRVVRDAFEGSKREDDAALLVLRTPVLSRRLFLMKVQAQRDAIRRVRTQMREWLAPLELSTTEEAAILIAVGEACTNAVEHAYAAGTRALFRVEASLTDDGVICCVSDAGAWKDNPDRFARGNGIAIMRELMDDVAIELGPGGTTVTLRYNLRMSDEPVVLA
ncbi:MAG: tmoS [Actinomycetia bacterium]|nr:tmoS [Actinomycetes bacterium]